MCTPLRPSNQPPEGRSTSPNQLSGADGMRRKVLLFEGRHFMRDDALLGMCQTSFRAGSLLLRSASGELRISTSSEPVGTHYAQKTLDERRRRRHVQVRFLGISALLSTSHRNTSLLSPFLSLPSLSDGSSMVA